MNDGYIKLFRKFTNWEWYSDINTKTLFLHLILTANHEDKKWKGIEVKKGQVLIGRKKLSEKLRLSEQQIRTALEHLKTTNEITTISTKKYTLVTLVNWEKYQDYDTRVTNNQLNEQPTGNHQVTTTKNEKNKRNIYIVEQIISHLNEKAGTNYKSKTKDTQNKINARLNEGYTLDDFIVVIDKKCNEWINDTKMQQYLRPETLFGTKFESYLNQPVKQNQTSNRKVISNGDGSFKIT